MVTDMVTPERQNVRGTRQQSAQETGTKEKASSEVLYPVSPYKTSLYAAIGTYRQHATKQVAEAGLEPAWGNPQGILNPQRLPFRHSARKGCSTLQVEETAFGKISRAARPEKACRPVDHAVSNQALRAFGLCLLPCLVCRCPARESG